MKVKRKNRFRVSGGEMWLGDCLKILPKLEEGSVDMIFADLPYGTTDCKWDTVIPLGPLWEQFRRVCRPGAAMVFTASQPFTSALIMSNPKEFKVEWIWKKNAGSNFGLVKWQPMKEHESIVIFSPKSATVDYNPILQERSAAGKLMIQNGVQSKTIKRDGMRKSSSLNESSYNTKSALKELRVPSSVQLFNRERGLHPTQKPVALVEYFIRTYSNEGDLILDPTFGSATTLVAAKNLQRRFVGIEQDRDYFFKGKERVQG